jgi:hypothetical protein
MAGLLGHLREDDIEVDFSDPKQWQDLMIKADHPILKRIDRVIQPYQMESLVLELINLGYENINIAAHKKRSE